jgi:hypothetical protein
MTVSVLSVAASLLVSFGNAASQIACPPKISVEQKASAPGGWSVEYSKNSAALSSVTIFDRPPEQQASLKYDAERTSKNEIIQTWMLPASDRGQWIECGYTNTTALLRRKLPDEVRACTAVLEKGVTYGDGGAIVKRAECQTAAQKPAH